MNQTVITLINTIKILLSSSCRIPGTDFKSSVFCTYLARLHISTIQSIGKTKSLPNILYPISLAVILSLSSTSACFRDAERSLLTVLIAGGLRCLLQGIRLHTSRLSSSLNAGSLLLHCCEQTSHYTCPVTIRTASSLPNARNICFLLQFSFALQNSTRPPYLQCCSSLVSVRRRALHSKPPLSARPKSCMQNNNNNVYCFIRYTKQIDVIT